MHSEDYYAVARYLSVRLSVTRRYFVETAKRILPSGSHIILVFSMPNGTPTFRREADPLTGASNVGGVRKSRFSTNISLYLINYTRQSHSYYRRRILNRPKLSTDSSFNDLEWAKLLVRWDMAIWRFSRWQMSAILHFRGPIMGSLISPCSTSYWSSVWDHGYETMALDCFVLFRKPRLFVHILATDRRMYRRRVPSHKGALAVVSSALKSYKAAVLTMLK